MKESLKDILSNLNPEVDQETLMLYLQGKLSSEQRHEVEKHIIDDDFESDALEGLESFKDKNKLADLVEHIKTHSSKFINSNRPVHGRFSWQEGYGAFPTAIHNWTRLFGTFRIKKATTSEDHSKENTSHCFANSTLRLRRSTRSSSSSNSSADLRQPPSKRH